MSGDRDPLKRLRRANPVRPDDLPSAGSAQGRALFERIIDDPTEERLRLPRRPGGRRRLWLRLLAPVLLIGLVAAGYAVVRAVSQPLDVSCYRDATLDSDEVAVRPVDERGPVESCASAWQPGGEFGTEQAPPLVACVLESGAVGVFPQVEGDTCQRLGLAAPDPRGSPANDAAVGLADALFDQFLDAGCLSQEQGERIVRGELELRGLDEWTVRIAQPFTAQRPCATLAFDVPTKTVILVPALPPPPD